jgi:hypothetical protein
MMWYLKAMFHEDETDLIRQHWNMKLRISTKLITPTLSLVPESTCEKK